MAVRRVGPSESEPAPDAVVWNDRWGKCLDGRVYILAALVVDVELALLDMSNLNAAVVALSEAIQEELPRAVACLNIHVLPGASQGGNKQVRLAMSGDAALCAQWHQRQLQGGKTLGGGAAFFHSLRDTTSVEHQQKMTELVSLHSAAETGFLLDLPSEWVRGCPESATMYLQQAGSLWYDFAAVWGPVKEAFLVRAQDPTAIHLLVDFRQSEGARCLFELLSDRYLYNPLAREPTYPVTCVLGNFQDLRLRVQPEDAGGVPGTFELRRLRGPELKTPQVIRVTPRRIKLGRDDSADIALQIAHISKVHATLQVIGEKLFIQDTSVNGTWVNDRRISNGLRVELRPRDRISFLPSYTRDAPTYEVQPPAQLVSASEARRTEELLRGLEPGPGPRRFASAAVPPAPKKKASSRRQLLAEPVAVVGQKRSREERSVVHLDGAEELEEVDAGDAAVILEDEGDEDVAAWAGRLDNGSLASYIPKLTSLFKGVSQIRSRYAGRQLRLSDFFEAVGVSDDDHRLAFATALRALSRPGRG